MRLGVALSLLVIASTTAAASAATDSSLDFDIHEDIPETSSAPAIASPSSSLDWSRCKFTAATGSDVDRDYFDCATLAVPVCYADSAPCSKGATRAHTLSLLRRETNATDAPTVWIVSESADDARTATIMERVRNGKDINVYAIQSRLWNPPSNEDDVERNTRTPCAKLAVDVGARVEIDGTMLDAATACHAWLVDTFGTNATNAFSLDSAARDLAIAMQIVQTQDLKSKNTNVYVLAMGQASRVLQRFIATSVSKSIRVVGYIFDTPHAMKLSTRYDETVGASMGRFLDGCTSHVECSTKFANLSMSMRDVLAKIEAAVDLPADQTSHCLGMLKNATFRPERDLKPSHGVRRFFAALRRTVIGYKVAAPLLYRLQRCNDKDHYGVDKLVSAVWTEYSKSPREALAVFAERVVTYSEFWSTPTTSRDALIDSFEKSLVSDGAMVAQQPAYCLYTANEASECTALYKRNSQANSSLKMTYPVQPSSPNVNASTGFIGSASASVLILASRLSLEGSASIANDLYTAFVRDTRNAVLIETDSVLAGSELEVPVADSQVLLQVVSAFVTNQTTQINGKWRAKDLSPPTTDWSKAKSTYESSPPVALTFTITQQERSTNALVDTDLYEYIQSTYTRPAYRPSQSSDSGGIWYGYYILLPAGLVLLAVFIVWARTRRNMLVMNELHQEIYQTPPPVQVNIVVPLPESAHELPSHGTMPVPHAILVEPPQYPHRTYQTAYTAASAPGLSAQAPSPSAPAVQWQSEPVNEYTYSYTPVTERTARRGN